MGSKNFGMIVFYLFGRMVFSNNILKIEMDIFVRNGKRLFNNILFSIFVFILNDGEYMVIFY